MNTAKPQYKNWVSAQLIAKMTLLFALFGAADILLFVFLPGWPALNIILGLFAAFFLVAILYFLSARRMFSPKGGDVQNQLLDKLVSQIGWDGMGEALDIGCGSGALAVKVAKRFPQARVTASDYWGGSWGYSQSLCEKNARAEGVVSRMEFEQANAAHLPFADERFDLAVSNLTFHEVRDHKDKRNVLREALRVVKKGGSFAFQDLFLIEPYYGPIGDLVRDLKASGIAEVRFVDTSKSPFIPRALRLPFMVGTVGILYGVK